MVMHESDIGRTDPVTLTQWILTQQQIKAPNARGNLSILLNAICVACKYVEAAVRKAGLAGVLGLAGSGNVQGEDQKKLDVLANEVFINVLRRCGQCSVLVSEEIEEEIIIEGGGDYSVMFDPLDGSSNIDCGVSIGTIYGIFKKPAAEAASVKNVLRPGRELVAAGYCLYGSSCSMVISVGGPPTHFTLDPSLGEFVLTSNALHVPESGKIYSINEGNSILWDGPTSQFVRECKRPANGGAPKSLRYVGSMVADVHRTLLYGGVFMYPADEKAKSGKLRLLYEGNPMAFLVENGGGRAITGAGAVLDLQPRSIHERSPIFLGSKQDIDRIEAFYEAGH
ncbi:g10528 [Coccomyxa elongata]